MSLFGGTDLRLVHKRAGGSRGLGFVINMQLPMTGQDKPRVFRGYREKPPRLDIFYQFLLSVIRTQHRGGGEGGGF